MAYREGLAPYMGMPGPRMGSTVSRRRPLEEEEESSTPTTYPDENAELESWALDEAADKGKPPSSRDKEILRALAQKTVDSYKIDELFRDKEPDSPMHPEADESLIDIGSIGEGARLFAGKPEFKSGVEEYEAYPLEEYEEGEELPEGSWTELGSTDKGTLWMGEPEIERVGEEPYPINEELALSIGTPQINGRDDTDIIDVGGEHPGILFPDDRGGFIFSPTTGPNAGLVFRVPEGAEARAVLEQSARAGEGYDSIEDLIAAESGGIVNPEAERTSRFNTLPIDRAARSHLLGIGPEYGWASKNRIKR